MIGARATLIWAGVIGAVVTLGALFLPGMRAIEGAPPLSAVDDESAEPAVDEREPDVDQRTAA